MPKLSVILSLSMFLTVALNGCLEDTVAVLWVLERQSFDGTFNLFHQSKSFFQIHNTVTAPITQNTKLVR